MPRDDLQRFLGEHREAVARYAAAARRVAPDGWSTPREPGAWSPAEITEHLALFFEVAVSDLQGGPGAAMITRGWTLRVLRWFLLPHILVHRSFPLRARSPRELRPGTLPAGRDEGLARLADLAKRFEETVEAAPAGATLTHPYFGELTPLKALRFSAVHLHHHTGQLAR